MRLLRALVVPCLLCAVLVVPAPAAAVRSQTAMLQELNKVRSSHGVRRLRTSPKLEQSAGGYAHWMMKNDWFGHRGAASGTGFARSGEILELHGGSREHSCSWDQR